MTILFPLTPINRHPLLEPNDWIGTLTRDIDLLGGNDKLRFIHNNSFAFLLSICGFQELAESVLLDSIRISLNDRSYVENLLDAFINIVRLANRSPGTGRFTYLQDICMKAVLNGDMLELPKDLIGRSLTLPLHGRQRIVLRKYLIYESIVYAARSKDNAVLNEINIHHELFSTAGLIFREMKECFLRESVLEIYPFDNDRVGVTEIVVKALHAGQDHEGSGRECFNAEYLSVALYFFAKLSEQKMINSRHFRIVEEIGYQARRAGYSDLAKRILSMGASMDTADWYMVRYFSAKAAGRECQSIRSTYLEVKDELMRLYEKWREVS